MNRSDLQRLSNSRIRKAKTLLAAAEYSGAYYLAGYSVECALKACFAKTVKRYDFPGKNRVYIHDLAELVELAGLKAEFNAVRRANLSLQANWVIVSTWNEESRYSSWSRESAESLLNAILQRKDGVLPWLKRRW
jgi:HEPN domain-containing protein